MMAKAARDPEPADASGGYRATAKRPLQILVFLLPLVLLYELGLVFTLRHGTDVLTNKAHGGLVTFFETLGVTGLYLGGVVIVVVLLIWHLLSRQRWHVDGTALVFMTAESLLLTLPLLALARLVDVGLGPLAGPDVELAGLGLLPRLSIAIGAGLYEELVFRMLLIAIVHTLLVDAIGVSHTVGAAVGIAVAAVAFTVYHPLRDASGSIMPARVAFFLAAGLYFGVLYVLRGFGITVATHAAYDVLVMTLAGPE